MPKQEQMPTPDEEQPQNQAKEEVAVKTEAGEAELEKSYQDLQKEAKEKFESRVQKLREWLKKAQNNLGFNFDMIEHGEVKDVPPEILDLCEAFKQKREQISREWEEGTAERKREEVEKLANDIQEI